MNRYARIYLNDMYMQKAINLSIEYSIWIILSWLNDILLKITSIFAYLHIFTVKMSSVKIAKYYNEYIYIYILLIHIYLEPLLSRIKIQISNKLFKLLELSIVDFTEYTSG